MAYLIESGLPTFSDVPWLTVSPTEATIAPDGSLDFEVTVDSTGLEPGVYRAIVVILTNDPENSLFQVPVTLIVPTYQQGVDAGGGPETNANGDVYAVDRGYPAGPYGYLGASSNRSTTAPIDGTEDDGLYQDRPDRDDETLSVRRAGRHLPGRPALRRDPEHQDRRSRVQRQPGGRRSSCPASTCMPPPAARTSPWTRRSW